MMLMSRRLDFVHCRLRRRSRGDSRGKRSTVYRTVTLSECPIDVPSNVIEQVLYPAS